MIKMNATSQDNPVVLITGSAKRIGAHIARFLHQHDMDIVLHYDTSETEALNLQDELNQQRLTSAHAIGIHLNSHEACDKLIKKTFAWKNKLSVLINNASVFYSDAMILSMPEKLTALYQTNVFVPRWLSLLSQNALEHERGCIINITDVHAQKPLTGYGDYCQSKAALDMQTKHMAQMLAPNIRVNAIAPGAIAWPEGVNALSCAQKQSILIKTPLKKHGHPEFIAKAVLHFIDNTFVTGQTLRVDGGRLII